METEFIQAAGRKSDETKGDVINELNVTLTRGLASMVNSPTPVIAAAVHSVQGMKNNIEADPVFFKQLLGQFNEQQSRSLIAALGTGNKGFKLDPLEKSTFPAS